MGRRSKHIPPFEMAVVSMGKGGVGVGETPDGSVAHVRFAPVGSTVAVTPMGRKKGVFQGRRTALLMPPPNAVEPTCPVFAVCGGCAMQELPLSAQRTAKTDFALSKVGSLDGVIVHATRGADAAYAYRNKVELSFGNKRYLAEEDHKAGLPHDGRWLGFHAPGRWDRIVDTDRCALVSEAVNAVIAIVREMTLQDDSPEPWDARAHTGFFRHLVLRQGFATGELLVAVYTTVADEAWTASAMALGEALINADLPDGAKVVGVVWGENDGLGDVARGVTRHQWGRDWLEEHLGSASFRLSVTSFFQTSTDGAVVLYDTIGDALGDAGGTLFDLYCGIGTIGQVLHEGFDKVIGIEERPEAIVDAEANAARNGCADKTVYRAAKVEKALDALHLETGRRALLVDPPRVGLHPKVALALASADAEVLVYVACNPGSLGRDRAVLETGGWVLTDMWVVDLFPQTGHIEVVGRFVRKPQQDQDSENSNTIGA